VYFDDLSEDNPREEDKVYPDVDSRTDGPARSNSKY